MLHKAASSCRKLSSATFCSSRLHKAIGAYEVGPVRRHPIAVVPWGPPDNGSDLRAAPEGPQRRVFNGSSKFQW
eukprot:12526098-Alexandrium_andersonii.AAC.1